jgi:hypothetical protein
MCRFELENAGLLDKSLELDDDREFQFRNFVKCTDDE